MSFAEIIDTPLATDAITTPKTPTLSLEVLGAAAKMIDEVAKKDMPSALFFESAGALTEGFLTSVDYGVVEGIPEVSRTYNFNHGTPWVRPPISVGGTSTTTAYSTPSIRVLSSPHLTDDNFIVLNNGTSSVTYNITWDTQNQYQIVGSYTVTGNMHDTASISWSNHYATWSMPEISAVDEMRERIRHNLSVKASRKRRALELANSPQEMKARSTLRDMLTEMEWRRYCTNGFIMVRGTEGRWYQVFQDQTRRTVVWKNKKREADLCIHTDKECPPTDHVLHLKLLIELDEASVWLGANVAPYISLGGISEGITVDNNAGLLTVAEPLVLGA